MDEKPVPVVVTPEARAKAIRSALLNDKVQVKMTAGQRRAVEAARQAQKPPTS
jgi:hypothetical protein